MKKFSIALIIFVSTLTTNVFSEIKMGIILGFTGPIESLTPAMAASAELAFKEASESGLLLEGEKILIGGNEIYKTLCRKHFRELTKLI